jgi:uncharacterized protein YecT (DUF1311 family)
LYVYKDRAANPGKPVFQTGVNIFSAFHSPDGKFFVVNLGSGSYGNVAVVFLQAASGEKPFISENDYRSILEKSLIDIFPKLKGGRLDHLYAPIRDIRDGEALLYAGGDFDFEVGDRIRQETFKGVFLGLNLEKRTVRRLDDKQGLKSWYRGLPDLDASYGSGFFVTPRQLLTNAHVVRNANRVSVGLGNKETWADVSAISTDYDLALLAIPENSFDGVPLALSQDQLVLGERVRAFGYPLPAIQGYTLKVTDGTVSGLLGLMDDPANFQCTAPIQPGNSGGPLLDDQNRLVGIAVASLNKISVAKATGRIPENVNFGIHLDLVRQFLKENHIELPSADAKQSFDPERSCVQIIALESDHSSIQQNSASTGQQTPGEKNPLPTQQELDDAEVELNRVYTSVRQRLDAAGKEHLKAIELQWLAVRKKANNDPTLYLQLTRDQIQRLKSLLSQLKAR